MKLIKRFFLIIFVIIVAMNSKNILKHFYPYKYKQDVLTYSKKYNVDPYLILAIIKAESNFNENATSAKNAHGLMQITSETAQWASEKMKIDNYNDQMLYEPKFNIDMGCWYVSDLTKEFNGNIDLVLAAYNGGRGNVQKWLNSQNHSSDGKTLEYIPFKETDKYVKKVKVNYNIYKYLYGTDSK